MQSPRKPNGLSHCIFECLISRLLRKPKIISASWPTGTRSGVAGSSIALATANATTSGPWWTTWPRHFGVNSGRLLPKAGVVGWSLMRLDRFDASSGVSGLDQHAAYSEATDFVVQ